MSWRGRGAIGVFATILSMGGFGCSPIPKRRTDAKPLRKTAANRPPKTQLRRAFTAFGERAARRRVLGQVERKFSPGCRQSARHDRTFLRRREARTGPRGG